MKKIIYAFFAFHLFLFSNAQFFTDTKGKLEISDSGTAGYTIAVALPPSIKGFAPKIDLTYNSSMRGGIAGQGWSISGISNISRISTRRDIDGFVDGVDFDADDKLALDGQRLLIKTGNYWENGSTYQTEYKSNSRIELKIETAGSYGPQTYFIVYNSDGSRTWYGSTGNGVIQNATSLVAWYVIRQEDANGNFITYNYSTIGDQRYISNIKFSGNEGLGLPQVNEVKFKFKTASRTNRDYTKGMAVYSSQLLENIEVYTNGALFRKYALQHSASDLGYDRVTQVMETNGSNEQSNPVKFDYYQSENNGQRIESDYSNTLNFDNAQLAGDFDGDGRLDFAADNKIFRNLFNGSSNSPINFPSSLISTRPKDMFVATTLSYGKINQFQSIVKAELSTTGVDFKVFNLVNNSLILQYSKKANFTMMPSGLAYDGEWTNFLEGDFNGDGVSDVLIATFPQTHPDLDPLSWCNLIWQGCSDCCNVIDANNYYLFDLNPDTPSVPGPSGMIRFNPNEYGTEVFPIGAGLSGSKRYVMDFNGDGKSDILNIYPDKQYKIWSYKELTQAPWGLFEVIGSGILDDYSASKQIVFGDYNGDGKGDILIPTTEGCSGCNGWIIYYGNPSLAGGSAFTKEFHTITEYWPVAQFQNNTDFNSYYAIDINKDGKSDLVRVWRSYYKPRWTINDHNTKWHVTGYSNNIGAGAGGFALTNDFGEQDSNSPDLPVPVASNYRYTGGNTELVLARGKNNKIEYYQFNKDASTDSRLKSVSESSGKIVHTIEYLPMELPEGTNGNSATSFYSVEAGVSYPFVEIRNDNRNFLVSKLKTTINGVSKFQDFRYRGFFSSFMYGSIGFKRNTRSSWYVSPSDTKIWTTNQIDFSQRGAITKTWTSTNGATVFNTFPTDLVASKNNYFDTYTDPVSKVFNIRLIEQVNLDVLTNVKVQSFFSYDGNINDMTSYGLETQKITNYYRGTVLQGSTKTSTAAAEYDNNPNGTGNSYYIGRPLKIFTERKIFQPATDTRTSEIKFAYDGANLVSTETKGHNTEYIKELMTHDGVGNVLTKTISSVGSVPAVAPRTTTNEYEPTKRFVKTKTDHQGFSQLLEYYNSGQVKKSTDYLGVINEFSYDDWGKIRSSKKTNAASSVLITTITYAKFSDGGYSVTSTNTSGDNAMSATRYNVLGQVIKTTKKGLTTNSLIQQDTEYDVYGRTYKVSLPYLSTASKWTFNYYDYLHRPIQITAPTGKITTFSYNGLVSTTVDDGKTTTVTLDALGNKIQSKDPGGEVNFSYYANGALKESDFEGNKVSIGIDGWGNKISLNDPNAGSYAYQYDVFGQIIKETTPKGYTQYDYDNYGKTTRKKIAGDGADYDILYGYNSFGQVLTETSTVPVNNVDFSYVYHPIYHHLTSVTENSPYLEQTKTLAYDSFGRISSETNYTREKSAANISSTITSKNVYSPYSGILYKITDENNATIWQLNTIDAKGNDLTSSLGNGINITNLFDDNYFLASQKHLKGTTAVLHNTYVFNTVKDQLSSRVNVALNITEYFTYDALDRLKTWTNPLTGIVDFNDYDNKGRITVNNKVGEVAYNENPSDGLYRKASIKLNDEGKAYYKQTLGGTQDVSYTMFKAPITISESGKGKMNFLYNSHLSRSRMEYDFGLIAPSTTKVQRKSKLYTDDGSTEVLYDVLANTVKIRTFIAGDAYSAVAYNEKSVNLNTGVTTEGRYYLHRDYLGSVLAISDNNGVAVEKRHFDAWGNLSKIVNSNNVELNVANGLQFLDRGYTSHEHLQEVGLINMNGRLYDPILKSFLMPDNNIQAPENSQNYNRYAYVFNNPLKYNDPSGEEGITIGVAMVIAVAVAITSYTLTALLTDIPFSVGGLLKTSFIAAASAAVTFGIGTAASTFTNFYSRAAFAAVAHGTVQGMATGASGGKFWSGFSAGAVSSVAASLWSGGGSTGGKYHRGIGNAIGMDNDFGMVAFGTVTGGATAELSGGNFWQGAASGLTVSLLNHAAHKLSDNDDNIYINSKNKTVSVERTGDDYDRIFVDGKEIMATQRGALGPALRLNGFKISEIGPYGMGMNLTDFVLDAYTFLSGAKLFKMGITKVSKSSVGYRVGFGASKETLESSVLFTKILGFKNLPVSRLPTLWGPAKDWGTFLGRNSPIIGTGMMGAGGYGMYETTK